MTEPKSHLRPLIAGHVHYHGQRLPGQIVRFGPPGCKCGACKAAWAKYARETAEWQASDGFRWMTLYTRNDPDGWRRTNGGRA